MKPIRIQRKDKDPPENNPFEFDLLNREEAVKTLTRLIGAIEEGPCVLAVDAPWGTGKTTFLKIWAQYLRNEQFPVVEFNAWKMDFSEDPFMALCAELTRGFGEGKSSGHAKEVKKAAARVIKHIGSNAMNIGSNAIEKMTIGLVVPTKLWAYLNEKAAKERLDKYQKAQDVIKEFKTKLEDMARGLNDRTAQADDGSQKPLVVMIDELDRCRPSYAVELLETAKHLFDVDRIVFVLAVNREQLEHAVKALYGNAFDAEGYLRRFFDLDFRLPAPERDDFITELFALVKTSDPRTEMLLKTFLGLSTLSLRDIAQAVHRLGLVLNALTYTDLHVARMVTVALILRTLDYKIYRRFVNGEVSDADVVEQIMGIRMQNPLEWKEDDELFQAIIIYAYKEVTNKHGTSPLEDKHQRIIKAEKGEEVIAKIQPILELVKEVQRLLRKENINFMTAHRYLELFSTE